ncbi:MAG: histone deacetylase family protein [Bacteroidales bacterium]|nr:histone deacetylase family protein [Bacteroidales bacterium]
MFRIRKISNPYLDVNIRAMEKVRQIIREQFPDIREEKIQEVEEQLVNPLKYKFQAILFIADDLNEAIRGFALFLHMPDLKICFLDFLAVTPGKTSSGVGGSLYERLREEAESLGSVGIFLECLPDDPALYRDPGPITQNKKRLAFYERYGARPIANTLYETPVKPEDDGPPYLVFDGLGVRDSIPGKTARKVVRAILERKYRDYCPVEYISKVVNSIREDPVRLRPFRYRKKEEALNVRTTLPERRKIFWIINDQHMIHHVRERGYVESPVRVAGIRRELEKTGLFRLGEVKEYPEKFILDVHDSGYVSYFKRVCRNLPPGKSVYPYVFPIRNAARPPKELSVRAGYYCIDTFTPLNQNAYLAARWGVNCVLTASDEILGGTMAAYVLTRPPGHHAEKFVFGGFCYFNNCAIAANYLSRFGRVAILDIDFHHGNGQQQIFYDRNDVLTISIHGHPSFAYPYFSGFREEKGEGAGYGYNVNFPLPEQTRPEEYRKVLGRALEIVSGFGPDFLVIALGLDTAKSDPTGTWGLTSGDFTQNGRMIGNLNHPTLVLQEGGYRIQALGSNARAFFTGFFGSRSILTKSDSLNLQT